MSLLEHKEEIVVDLDGSFFKFKIPTLKDHLQVQSRVAEILEYKPQEGVTENHKFLASAIAHIEILMVDSPDWFTDVWEYPDTTILFEIIGGYTKRLTEFQEKMRTKRRKKRDKK